ncbi:MAG: aminotransferase class V-fold PLP-dependent enzyme [Dethiosulfatibacter sp.]|nr:aminotransferase class V-fold PLP-dependent enzyme [Dethiosulfatibacter sp.]
MIYFDNAATSFPKPENVLRALDLANRNYAFNAGRGGYRQANNAQNIIIELKHALCDMVNIPKSEKNVYLTESATLAMNVLIQGLGINEESNIYVSPFEHNAVMRPLELLRQRVGFSLIVIPYDAKLNIMTDNFRHLNALKPADFVFLNYASNVLGNIIDISTIQEIVKSSSAKIIVDASQALGLLPIDLDKLEIDYLIFASHKTLYGPIGLGGIVSSNIQSLTPFLAGGTGNDSLNLKTEKVVDIGSPNVVAAYGLFEAIKWINDLSVEIVHKHVMRLTKSAINQIEEISSITILGDKNKIQTGIIPIIHKGYTPNELAMVLDLDFDIAVRAGYQCAPLIHEVLGTISSGGVLRISMGYFNTMEDVERLINALSEIN